MPRLGLFEVGAGHPAAVLPRQAARQAARQAVLRVDQPRLRSSNFDNNLRRSLAIRRFLVLMRLPRLPRQKISQTKARRQSDLDFGGDFSVLKPGSGWGKVSFPWQMNLSMKRRSNRQRQKPRPKRLRPQSRQNRRLLNVLPAILLLGQTWPKLSSGNIPRFTLT